MKRLRLAPILVVAALLPACAAAQAPAPAAAPPPADSTATDATAADFTATDFTATDARLPIAVLPLGLSETASLRYPQLAERTVGFGVHAMLVNHLYDSGRFRFVEDKPEMVEDILERQWMSASGAVEPSSAVEHGKLLGARYVVYGEVYDFASLRLSKKKATTRLALQVRLVDVETGEYVPASGSASLELEGEVFPGEVEFARSTVGVVSDQAIREAVAQLLRRFEQP